jgi:hypothetical protein
VVLALGLVLGLVLHALGLLTLGLLTLLVGHLVLLGALVRLLAGGLAGHGTKGGACGAGKRPANSLIRLLLGLLILLLGLRVLLLVRHKHHLLMYDWRNPR